MQRLSTPGRGCAVYVVGVVVVGALVLAGATSARESTSAGAPRVLGLYQPGVPRSGIANVRVEVERAGWQPAIVNWFQPWGVPGESDWRPGWVRAVTEAGMTPFISWEPWVWDGNPQQPRYALAQIASGAFDGYVHAWAVGAKRVGSTVYLAPLQEADAAATYPWSIGTNGATPSLYVAAWRRIVRIFRAAGAKNVRFVWSVVGNSRLPFERFYPGARYVDVLGLNGINGGSAIPAWGGWRTFREIFDGPYQRIARLGSQPIWISSTATTARGGDKRAWIAGMLASFRGGRYPRVCAVIWFDEDKEADWALPDAGSETPPLRAVGSCRSAAAT